MTVPLHGSGHSVFAERSWCDYLIRFSELSREMDDMIGRKAGAEVKRMRDHRDCPPGRREHKWGLHRPEGLHIDRGNGSAFTRFPRAPSILDIPPKSTGEASARQGHHSACLRGKQRTLCCSRWSSAMIDGGPFVE